MQETKALSDEKVDWIYKKKKNEKGIFTRAKQINFIKKKVLIDCFSLCLSLSLSLCLF